MKEKQIWWDAVTKTSAGVITLRKGRKIQKLNTYEKEYQKKCRGAEKYKKKVWTDKEIEN